jgi:hypothetical protein
MRFAINRERLENLLLNELRASQGCSGAEAVFIRPVRERVSLRNWQIDAFDSGTSDTPTCRSALESIYPRFAAKYELVGA